MKSEERKLEVDASVGDTSWLLSLEEDGWRVTSKRGTQVIEETSSRRHRTFYDAVEKLDADVRESLLRRIAIVIQMEWDKVVGK